MTISIRPATLGDIEPIRQVTVDTVLATFPNEEHKITVEDVRLDLEDMASVVSVSKDVQDSINPSNRRLFLVALVNGSIAGIMTCKKKDGLGKIISLFVSPKHQNKGVGSALLKAASEFFTGTDQILLTVESYNIRAKNFYLKHGFSETGRVFSKHQVKSGAYLPETEMSCKMIHF